MTDVGEGENSDWRKIAASLLGGQREVNTVPAAPPSSERLCRALAGLSRTQASPWASVPSSLAGTPPARSALSSAVAAAPLPQAPANLQWIYVTRRFDYIIDAIGILQDEVDDGMKKVGRLIGSLNRCYWDYSSETDHALLLGSWAKQTRVRPFSDLDVMFVLPLSVYYRFEQHCGNKQSDLLQEVRKNLFLTYPRTEIWGDRHVVASEVDGVMIEVVPAFRLDNGQYWVCDTKDSGRYKVADPAAELRALEDADTKYNHNARQLTRLLKKWQIQDNVSIKAFQLERLAVDFLAGWHNNTRDRFWYDWMMRDFFLYMTGRANGFAQMPGTAEWISLGSAWLPAAQRAYKSALAACAFEQANLETQAGRAWQEIFGTAAPVSV